MGRRRCLCLQTAPALDTAQQSSARADGRKGVLQRGAALLSASLPECCSALLSTAQPGFRLPGLPVLLQCRQTESRRAAALAMVGFQIGDRELRAQQLSGNSSAVCPRPAGHQWGRADACQLTRPLPPSTAARLGVRRALRSLDSTT